MTAVLDRAREFVARWPRQRPLLPPEVDSRGFCLVWYADFIVLFKPDGFNVGKKSDFATNQVLTDAIELAAEMHNKPLKAEAN